MPGATERIAAKLAARKAGTPVAVVADEPEDEEEPEVEEEESTVEADDELEDIEEPQPISMKDRAAAARAKRQPATTTAKPAKKAPSAAQLAAREKFAAASRARAAAKKADEAEEPATKTKPAAKPAPTKGKPVQTEADVKASQAAKRKAEQEARATAAKPKATGSSKAEVVKPAAPKAPAKAPAKDPVKKAKATANGPKADQGETKKQVLALWAKGKSRAEIQETLGLSYASVFYHTRGIEGTGANVRGRIFVDTPLDADGNKMPRGKHETVSRSEAMRRDYLSGMAVGDIGRKYEVRYQLAYTAIRQLLTEDDE